MGRMFWKFFAVFLLAQLTAIGGVSLMFWIRHQALEPLRDVAHGPHAAFVVSSAADTLAHGGVKALSQLMAEWQNQPLPPVYALDESGRELLGRPVPADIREHLERLEDDRDGDGHPAPVRRLDGGNGHTYLLFVPGFSRWSGGLPPREHRGIPLAPLVAAVVASVIFGALAARYFSSPIRRLRQAFKALEQGDMSIRLTPDLGRSRDELGELGRDFDHMVAQLQSLMDGQRRLLHDVSHELRSPLARLQIAIDLIQQRPERLQPSLERIETEAGRMDRLVGELLTLARLESGLDKREYESLSLPELLAAVVEDARFEAVGRRVGLAMPEAASMLGQPDLLRRAMENVIRNAIRHTPVGGVVDVSLTSEGQCVKLVVTDQGPGVPEQDLEAIFAPFFRSGDSRGTEGHGLGL
ncbi:MAG: HAMP domain-containing protein, partial [Betaproteobacteria bacterium]|nr:HAMP domain-containing protein [Betaproteobacteria bacterium]